MVLGLLALYGPGYWRNLAETFPIRCLNDDATLHVVPFLRLHEPGVLERDLGATYLMATFPVGYRFLYSALAPWWDPRIASKVVAAGLLCAFLLALGVASSRKYRSCWTYSPDLMRFLRSRPRLT
jgi:hypothetical protein